MPGNPPFTFAPHRVPRHRFLCRGTPLGLPGMNFTHAGKHTLNAEKPPDGVARPEALKFCKLKLNPH